MKTLVDLVDSACSRAKIVNFGEDQAGGVVWNCSFLAETRVAISVSHTHTNGHFLTGGGNGTVGMRHSCGKSVRRRAPHK